MNFIVLSTEHTERVIENKTKNQIQFDPKKTDLFHFNTQKLSFYLNKQLDN